MHYLFVAGLYKTEDKPSVHNRQQIIKKEGKARIQSLNHFCVLGNRTYTMMMMTVTLTVRRTRGGHSHLLKPCHNVTSDCAN